MACSDGIEVTNADQNSELFLHFPLQLAACNQRGCLTPRLKQYTGVSDEVFRETLELAAEADTPFSGVLCGRATWQDGIPVYGQGGAAALRSWLEDQGAEHPGTQ